jgi:hypothetical protein
MKRTFVIAALLVSTCTFFASSSAYAQRRGGFFGGGSRSIFSGGSSTRRGYQPTTNNWNGGHRPWSMTRPNTRWPNGNGRFPARPWNRRPGFNTTVIFNSVPNTIDSTGSVGDNTTGSSSDVTIDSSGDSASSGGCSSGSCDPGIAPDASGNGSADGAVAASTDDQSTDSSGSQVQLQSNDLPAGSEPASAETAGTTALVTIVNPAETRHTVHYVFAADAASLDAGMQNVHGQAGQEISFDRGGSYGPARYTLNAGTYRFVATAQGWDLQSVAQ